MTIQSTPAKMEVMVQMLIALSIVLATIIITRILRVVNSVWLRPKKLEKHLRGQGFKGNPYKLLLGDIPELAKMGKAETSKHITLSDDVIPHTFPFFNRIITKYGKSSFIWFGPQPRLNITDTVLIKEILSKPNIFHKPHPEPLRDMMIGGLLVLEDEKWNKHRMIINPAFHLEKLKNMIPAIYSSCSNMIEKWEKLIPTGGLAEVDVFTYLDNLSGDVISRTAFGSNHEEGERIFQLQKEQVTLALQLMPITLIPGWRFLPIKANRRFKQVCSEVEALLKRIIDKRQKSVEMGEAYKSDLLGILLESNSREMNESGYGMSTVEVINECKLFYFAGAETTSNLLTWTMILLSIHQNWQIQAREEVLQVFESRESDFGGLNHLKIVTMIFHEVLRLYPPATMLVRAISKDAKLGTMTIPAGVQFLVHTMLVHRDCEIWGEDAAEFKPERFSQGVSNATKGEVCYFPFGGGPRICIGQNYAMIEAKMAIAMILKTFSFELSPSYKHSPTAILTLTPKFGAQIILRKLG